MARARFSFWRCAWLRSHDQLLLPRLKFHLGTQGVEARRQTGFEHVAGLLEQRLGRAHLHLGHIHARDIGHGQQVSIAHHQHHAVAHVLQGMSGGFLVLVGDALVLNGGPVEDALGDEGA